MESVQRLQINATSSLTPEQLEVFSLFQLMGVQMTNSNFKALWSLVEMNIPVADIMNLLQDIAKQN